MSQTTRDFLQLIGLVFQLLGLVTVLIATALLVRRK